MESNSRQDKEYTKSLFRCPICGNIVGCSKEGKIGPFGYSAFRRHVQNCRKSPGVKPESEQTRE